MLLLMLRSWQKKTTRISDPIERADVLLRGANASILTGWKAAAQASFLRTNQQLEAVGFGAGTGPSFGRVWGKLSDLAETSAARGAHGIVNRMLAEELGQGGKLGLNLEGVAASEAAEAYNRARDEVIDRLPKNVQDELWLRRETAGDRNVCGRCERLDGRIAPARVGISPRTPLHSKCRCTDSIISHDEAMAYADATAYPERSSSKPTGKPAPIPASPAKPTAAKTTKPRAPRKVNPEVAAKREAVAKAKAELAAAKRLATEEKRKLAAEAKAAKEAAKIQKAQAKASKSTRVKYPKVDKPVQVQLKILDAERDAAANRLASAEARTAAGKPDKWDSVSAYKTELRGIAERRSRIEAAARVRASVSEVGTVDEAIKARILDQSQRTVISNFTGNSYSAIRRAQSAEFERLASIDKEFWNDLSKAGKKLESAIKDNVQFRGELWRGIVVDDETAAKILRSKELDWLGSTTSTSTSRSVAADKFAKAGEGSVGIVFRIRNGRGLAIEDLGIQTEKEVLMSGASKFRTIGAPVRDGNRWLVELEQIEKKTARAAVRKTAEEKLAASETRATAAQAKQAAAAEKRAQAAAKRADAAKAKQEAADAKRLAAEQKKAVAAGKRAEAAAKRNARAEAAKAGPKSAAGRVVIDKKWKPKPTLTMEERRESLTSLKISYKSTITETKNGVLKLSDDGKTIRESTRRHLERTTGIKSWETRHGRENFGKVRFTSKGIPDTYSAGHDWDGTILCHDNNAKEFLGGLRSGNSDQLKVMIHEELHGCSSIARSAYDMVVDGNRFTLKAGSAIEESTTEYLAGKSMGMTWIQSTHPYRIIGDDLVDMISSATGVRKNEAIKLFDRAAQYTRRDGATIAESPLKMAKEFAAGVAPNDAKARAKLVKSLMSYERTF